MKTFGILFVFISFSFAGIYFYIKNISVLKSIKRAEEFLSMVLLYLKNEQMTVSEIFENISKNADFETKKFIKNIRPNSLKDSAITAEECGFSRNKTVTEILNKVFSVLGKYPYEEQIKEINFCREKLNDLYIKSEDGTKQKAKLSAYSGLLGGFLAVIFLI